MVSSPEVERSAVRAVAPIRGQGPAAEPIPEEDRQAEPIPEEDRQAEPILEADWLEGLPVGAPRMECSQHLRGCDVCQLLMGARSTHRWDVLLAWRPMTGSDGASAAPRDRLPATCVMPAAGTTA